MFLYLEITSDHIKACENNASLKDKKAFISYTETFDILKPEGRKKIMDIMFYMARIQTYDFSVPF